MILESLTVLQAQLGEQLMSSSVKHTTDGTGNTMEHTIFLNLPLTIQGMNLRIH